MNERLNGEEDVRAADAPPRSPIDRAETWLVGRIGPHDDITAAWSSAFFEACRRNGFRSLVLRIDSSGGDGPEARAILDALRASGLRTTAVIEGEGSSAASIIACGCDRIFARPNAVMCIHEPAIIDWHGERQDRRCIQEGLAGLDETREVLLAAYSRTGLSRERLSEMLKEETWLTADEAQRLGFVDGILPHGEQVPDEDLSAGSDAAAHGAKPPACVASANARIGQLLATGRLDEAGDLLRSYGFTSSLTRPRS